MKSVTGSRLRNVVCFKQKNTGRWIMSRNTIIMLIYHRHRLLDPIYLNAVSGILYYIYRFGERYLWRLKILETSS
jgi:hypothetical protein